MIGYCLSRNRGYENPIAAALVSLATLIIMMPGSVTVIPDGASDGVSVSGVLAFSNTGTQAMFAGILIGLAATELFIFVTGIKSCRSTWETAFLRGGQLLFRADPLYFGHVLFCHYFRNLK